MTLDDLHFLLSPEGKRWLRETADPPITADNHLQIASRLRRHLSPSQAHAVLETVMLRQQAAAKFSRADQMYFLREALEQATAEVVAIHRAQRFVAAGKERVADLGCGIGGDALALAAHADVTGVEWGPVRLAMAQENVRVYGYGDRFHPLQADLMELTPLPVHAAFFDPARRDERGRRLYSVADYRPPLSVIRRWRTWVPDVAVKISPGVDYTELPDDAEVEFISAAGEVKEAVLWFGALRTSVARRATLLPAGESLTTTAESDPVAVTVPQAYLYEPDGAVIRAHLVQHLARQLGATQIDREIAYLTAETAVSTPFARCFVLEDWFPFQLKRLRAYLRERNVGQVVIKKRGSPLEPDALRRRLRLQGSERRIIFLTHVQGEAAVLVGREIKTD